MFTPFPPVPSSLLPKNCFLNIGASLCFKSKAVWRSNLVPTYLPLLLRTSTVPSGRFAAFSTLSNICNSIPNTIALAACSEKYVKLSEFPPTELTPTVPNDVVLIPTSPKSTTAWLFSELSTAASNVSYIPFVSPTPSIATK